MARRRPKDGRRGGRVAAGEMLIVRRVAACRGGEAGTGSAGLDWLSAQQGRGHQALVVPEVVEAALELDRALGAEVALEHLAIVADRLDGVEGPGIVEAELDAEIAGHAEQALDLRRGRA